jgi:two-component system alkaline phosphatase synthesis response regulator PhoP
MSVSGRILLVEDEPNLGSTLSERLAAEGFEVSWETTREAALERLRGRRFDLAVLDVGLPDGNGFQVAETLKREHRGTAVLFLTAQGSPEDRVRGLELGAEDYVVKPFHYKELLLRIRNGLRRARFVASDLAVEGVPIGKALVHFARFEAEADGKTYSLTHKECAVLKLLADRRGRVVSRDEILDEAWSEDEFPSPRTVDNFISRLRKLVEPDPNQPQVIRSIRGVGYQLG